MEKFPIKQAFIFGWDTLKNNFLLAFAFSISFSGIIYLPEILELILNIKIHPLLNVIYSASLGVIPWLFFMKFSLNCYDQKENKFENIFLNRQLIIKYIVAQFLFFLICSIGALFLIIPGIYFYIRLYFYGYLIIDNDYSLSESFDQSWEITKGRIWHLIVFVLASMGVILLGILCIFSSSFLTIKAFNLIGSLTLSETAIERVLIAWSLLFGLIIFFTIVFASVFIYRKLLETQDKKAKKTL